MKKVLLIILALVMLLPLCFLSVSAEEAAPQQEEKKCTVEVKNITEQGKIYTPQTHWCLVNYLGNLVDGDYSTGAGSESATRGTNRFMTFGKPMNISMVRIYVNYDGDADVSGNDVNLSKIKNQDKNFIFVAHPKEQSAYNRLCQLSFNTKDKIYVEFTSEDWKNQPVQEIEIWNDGYDTTYVIYEIEVFAEDGEHAWELTSTTTAPTCTTEGSGTYTCECGKTKTDVIPATGHTLNTQWQVDEEKGTHYNTCVDCTDRVNEDEHKYDNVCDNDCNVCATQREVPDHVWASDCDVRCENCPFMRIATVEHEYGGVCDDECNNCKYKRTVTSEHVYDNACDPDCNVCKTARVPAEHEYSAICDEYCNVCQALRETEEPHKYTKECDVDCNVCFAKRVPLQDHKYSNACDATCNGCGLERDVAGHSYINNCARACQVCTKLRPESEIPDHVYSNNCDEDCNECGEKRVPEKHQYGEWMELYSATAEKEGYRVRYCTSCQLENSETIPALGGTSDKATTVIVAVSCSVVIGGCTAIGVWQLGIKKLLANKKLKLEAQKKAELEAQSKENEDYDEDDEDYEDDEEETES